MSLAVVNNSIQIFDCDTDAMDGLVGTLDEDFKYEGTGCIGVDTDIETNLIWKTITQADFTGRHYLAALMCLTGPTMDIQANGGYQLCLEDSSGNQGYWYVAGSDNNSGAWKRFIIDADSTPTANNGTDPTITAIVKVGIGFKGIAKSKLAANTFWDDLRYDTASSRGIVITGGSSGTPDDFEELLVQDIAGSIGQIRKVGSTYFLQGTFLFSSATGDLWFTDKTKWIEFENDLVADGYHKIQGVGGTGTTEIYFGEKSGLDGIKGCAFKSGGIVKVQFDMSNTNIDKFGIYGCIFQDCGVVIFQPAATDKEVLNPTFDSCAEVIPDTIKFENFNIISSDGFGIRMIPGHGIKNGKIIAPGTSGVEIVPTVADQTFIFDNIKFSGADGISTYDLYSNTSYDLIASMVNGSDAGHKNEAGAGIITISNDVSIDFLILDAVTDLPIQYSHIMLLKKSDHSTQIVNDETDANGELSVAYNFLGDLDVVGWVRQWDINGEDYTPKDISGTITSNGFNLTVKLEPI